MFWQLGEGPKYGRTESKWISRSWLGADQLLEIKKKSSFFHSRWISLCFMRHCKCPGMCENGVKHTIALTSLFSTPSEPKKLRNNEMCMPQYPDPLLSIVCDCAVCRLSLSCKCKLVYSSWTVCWPEGTSYTCFWIAWGSHGTWCVLWRHRKKVQTLHRKFPRLESNSKPSLSKVTTHSPLPSLLFSRQKSCE